MRAGGHDDLVGLLLGHHILAEDLDQFVTSQIALWKGVIDKEGLQLDVN